MKRFLIIIVLLLQTQFNYLFSQEQSVKGSVVCVHGFFRSFKSMLPLGNSLKREGLKVYLWEYESRKKTIERHAADLVGLLKEIAAEKPGEPIYFVTHSLGGIIVRAAVNHPECPKEVAFGKAVLLAPPNKGASLARQFQDFPPARGLFGNNSGKQLLTYEENHMDSLGQFPESMQVLVIAGEKESPVFRRWMTKPNDGKVTVEETYLKTPHEHKTLYVSHSWIMTSREVIGITKEFILNKNASASH